MSANALARHSYPSEKLSARDRAQSNEITDALIQRSSIWINSARARRRVRSHTHMCARTRRLMRASRLMPHHQHYIFCSLSLLGSCLRGERLAARKTRMTSFLNVKHLHWCPQTYRGFFVCVLSLGFPQQLSAALVLRNAAFSDSLFLSKSKSHTAPPLCEARRWCGFQLTQLKSTRPTRSRHRSAQF